MNVSELSHNENVWYLVKCVNDQHAKRELTMGENYIVCSFEENNFLVKNDYGGNCVMGIWRFELIEIIKHS